MRSLHYLKAFRLEHGGVVRAVLDMASCQARAGADVTVATCDAKDIPATWLSGEPGTPRVVVLQPPSAFATMDRSFARQVRPLISGCDVVHLHVIWDASQLVFAHLARQLSVPCVQSAHGMLDDWSMAQSSLKKRIYRHTAGRAMFRSFAAVHCTAEGEARQTGRWVGPERVCVVPLILDLSPYENLPDRETCQSHLPGRVGAFRVAFLGRLHHKKGLEHLIQAAATLKQLGHPVEVIVGGTGEADYERTLKSLVASSGLEESIHFLGHVDGADKVRLLRGADVLVLPSHQENFGIVLIEALACGTPVVTTKGVDIWPELLESKGAVVIDRPEAAAVSNAMRELAEDLPRRRAMGLAARRWVQATLDPAVVTSQYLGLYERIVAEAKFTTGETDPNAPPLLALINNVQTPYRIHLHQRIVREVPEVRIASLYTHNEADQPWDSRPVAETNPVIFGRSQSVKTQSSARWAMEDWRKGARIIAWLKRHQARAVILGGYNDLTRLRIIRWCRLTGVPCFIIADSNSRGDLASGLKLRIKKVLVGWVVRQATGLMPCGARGREFFARYGATSDRCFDVPYEPDYNLIASLPQAQILEAARQYGFDPTRKRLVVCARLAKVKRVDLAIDAFAAIASERPDWDLVIIGDGALREELRARVPADLRHRVTWTGFIGDQARISAIYRLSHVLVCPSDWEPWGVVVNEAAAAGLAIVASSVVGAAPELVVDGVNGFQFPASNLGALIDNLRKVTSHDTISHLRAGTSTVLATWRRDGDPIAGLRRALSFAGVLHGCSTAETITNAVS